MNYHISKRAGIEEALKKYVSTVWKVDRGPIENIFRLAPYAMVPFLGGIGSIVALIITNIAGHILGISPADFGRELDQALGLGPGDDPRAAGVMPKLEELIDNLINTRVTANDDYPISKTASVWSLLVRGGHVGKLLAKGIFKIIAVLSSIFVFSHLGELYEEIASPAREQVSEWVEPKIDVMEEPVEEKEPSSAEELAEYIEQKYGLK